MGGDEFVLLTTTPGSIGDLAAAGRKALSETGHGFHITAAGGMVSLPGEATAATDALRLADQRMYAEKYQGRATSPRHGTSMLLAVLNERYPQLGEHSDGVTSLAVAVGSLMGLTAVQLEELQQASQLHDIGKLAIPDAILDKPGPLTDQEWVFIRRHTVIGERILGSAPTLAAVGKIVRSSHERYDGAGYPDGLAGAQIPLAARIVLVCDAYEAMTSHRSYRRGSSPQEAIAELRRYAGTQFDPEVVDQFVHALGDPAVAATSQLLAVGSPNA
jgi:HD-GYP domain-containing protein (c-di-GMP phosphodiesterase class II)